jgi:hypothetical protein
MFMGVPVGEYCADFLYAWYWYGAGCEGMAVAVENWVAMVAIVVYVRWVLGSEGATLECCYTVSMFEGFARRNGTDKGRLAVEDPGCARVQRGRIQSERSQRKAATTTDSGAYAVGTTVDPGEEVLVWC